MSDTTISIRVGADAMTTMINPFTVDAADQAELVALEVTGITEIASAMPGFVRGSIHRSLDGTRVVNYIQWADADSWANAHAALAHDERYRAHMADVQRIAAADPRAYEVVAVIEGRSTQS